MFNCIVVVLKVWNYILYVIICCKFGFKWIKINYRKRKYLYINRLIYIFILRKIYEKNIFRKLNMFWYFLKIVLFKFWWINNINILVVIVLVFNVFVCGV